MNLLAFTTQPSIYHGCYTWKTFWEENFTIGEFTPVNMKNYGRHNVRKYREIKDGKKYITLEIFLKFVSLDNMRIAYSEPKYYLGRSGKGLITSMDLKTNVRSNKNKKSRYAITNVSMKDISKMIKDFEKLP